MKSAWIAAWLLAAAGPVSASPPDFGQPVVCPRCDVLLVLLPGLRADSVTPERMPRLTEWMRQRRAVHFTQAVSPSSWYLPAAISILTGRLPSQHGVSNEPPFQGPRPPSLPDVATLPGELHGAGYRTAAFCATGISEPRFALDRGFDSYTPFPREADLDALAPQALDWTRQGGQPWMLTLLSFQAQGWRSSAYGREGAARKWKDFRHLAMSQTLFGLDGAEVAELRSYHDGLLRQTDDELSQLLKQLPRRMVVVIASTNGEEFGEHGGMDHGLTLYDEAVRVPLLVASPGVPHYREQDHQLSLREIGPMVLDYVGVRRSLGPETPMFNRIDMLQGAGMDEPAVSQTDFLGLAHLASLRSGDGWKLVSDRTTKKTQLFFLVEDPQEKQDLSAERPDLAESYGRQLDELMQPEGRP